MSVRTPSPRALAAALFAALSASCGGAAHAPAPAHVHPAAPPPASAPAAVAGGGSGVVRPTPADVRFMQGMIGHHAQALEMTALVPARSSRDDVRLVAERISVTQQGETELMQRWLRHRGEAVPDPHAQHGADAHGAMSGMPGMSGTSGTHRMPGMLTPEEMARLAAATGAEFDRLFLEAMIRHHQGALTMVTELLATQGAAQEAETFQFVSEVDSDQRMEIARMRTLLGGPPPSTPEPRPE